MIDEWNEGDRINKRSRKKKLKPSSGKVEKTEARPSRLFIQHSSNARFKSAFRSHAAVYYTYLSLHTGALQATNIPTARVRCGGAVSRRGKMKAAGLCGARARFIC